jgi:hypothetical protein
MGKKSFFRISIVGSDLTIVWEYVEKNSEFLTKKILRLWCLKEEENVFSADFDFH